LSIYEKRRFFKRGISTIGSDIIKENVMKVGKLFLLSIIGMLISSVCFFGCKRKEITREHTTNNTNTRIEKTIGTTKIILLDGVDIVTIDEVEAIVNATNEGLAAECNRLGNFPGFSVKCPAGQAVITGSYNPVVRGIRYVVHAVGPRIVGTVTSKNQADLSSAHIQSLTVASTRGVRRIAFPCISTTIFGYLPWRSGCSYSV
jgi:hypothetical protein